MLLMLPVKFTRHSKNRMRLHKITKLEAQAAIEHPDFVEPSEEGRLNAWKKVSEKFLRVTYKKEAGRFLVVTAVKKKKGWR